jgi:hypothetical protein
MTFPEFHPSYDATQYLALRYGDRTVYCKFNTIVQYTLKQYVFLHRFQLGLPDPLDLDNFEYLRSVEYAQFYRDGNMIAQPGELYVIKNACIEEFESSKPQPKNLKGFGCSKPQPKNVYVITNVLVGEESGLVVMVVREKNWVERARALYTEAMLPFCCSGASTDLDTVYGEVKELLTEFDAAIAGNHYTVVPTSPETPEQVINYVHG